MPSGAKQRVKVKKLKSKHEKQKGRKKSVSCGFGKIYDDKAKKCRPITYREHDEITKGKAKGYVAGGALGQKVAGVWGQIGGSIYGRYAGGKMAKKKLRKSYKKKK
jgi:outer membrane lipoprotein SlyB